MSYCLSRLGSTAVTVMGPRHAWPYGEWRYETASSLIEVIFFDEDFPDSVSNRGNGRAEDAILGEAR